MSKYTRLSSFWLKVLAILFMTIDHIALIIMAPYVVRDTIWYDVYQILRILGRMSFPLFAFLVVESVTYTSNRGRYLMRLGGSAIILGLVLAIAQHFNYMPGRSFNIFLDLFFGAAIITCLSLPKYQKSYALIPLTAVILLLIFDQSLPSYLCFEYHFYGITLILLFYLAKKLASIYQKGMADHLGMELETYEQLSPVQFMSNLFAFGFLVIINLAYWGVTKVHPTWDVVNASLQVWSILGGLIFLLYGGKRGYHSKWFQYGCYLYYPLHMVIIYVIYLCI